MRRLSFSSLRVRLLLLVLLAVVPALGLILYTASEQRRLAAGEVQEQALRLAWIAATDQGQLTEGARQLLIALAQLPAVRGRDPAACSSLFAELLKQYPRYANLAAVNRMGIRSAAPSRSPAQSARPIGSIFDAPSRRTTSPSASTRSGASLAKPRSISAIPSSTRRTECRRWSSLRWIWPGSINSRPKRACPAVRRSP